MAEQLLLALFKALPGTLLVLYGVSGEPAKLSLPAKAAAVCLFAIVYYLLAFRFSSWLYIGSALIMCAAAMGLGCFLSRRPKPTSCILGASTMLCLQAVQAFVITVTRFFVADINVFVASLSAANLVIELICCLICLPAVWGIRRLTFAEGAETFRFSQLAWLLPSLCVYLCLTLWQIPNFEDTFRSIDWMPLVIVGLMALLCIAALLFPLYLTKVAKERLEMEYMERLAARYYEGMMARKSSDDEVRRTVHDLRNQIQCALENIDEGAGRQQLEELSANLGGAQFVSFTGNPTMDTVLNQKRRAAGAIGADFSVMPHAVPHDLMRESDLCALVSNALDNAIEECERLGPGVPRYVDVKLFDRGDYLAMVFTNPCLPERTTAGGAIPRTSKPDAASHGIGLSSIRYCVAKYHGNCSIEASNGQFKLTVLLPLEQEHPRVGMPARW